MKVDHESILVRVHACSIIFFLGEIYEIIGCHSFSSNAERAKPVLKMIVVVKIDIAKRFERRQFDLKITSEASLYQRQIIIKIQDTLLKEAEANFDQLANSPFVDGIKEVLIPIMMKEKVFMD